MQHTTLYSAFDVHPSSKGASTHITHFSKALFDFGGGGWLNVMADENLPLEEIKQEKQRKNNTKNATNTIEITRFLGDIPNYLLRAQAFTDALLEKLFLQNNLQICHFRDIWSGLAILSNPRKNYKTIFEVNGLPSIELPYRYPNLSKKTLEKIIILEDFCLNNCDKIIVPSLEISKKIISRNIPKEKITVIPNGADLQKLRPRPQDAPERYIIYFGALQSWQGIDTLFTAFALIASIFEDLKLVICSANKPRQVKNYHKLAEKLNLSDRIIWKYQLPKRVLAGWVANALFSVAPLKECSRNLEQGCSPLKILESMALATPVIASDIPAVKEIISNEQIGALVRADRPAVLARMMQKWLENDTQTKEIGKNARAFIRKNFSWKVQIGILTKVYEDLMQDLTEDLTNQKQTNLSTNLSTDLSATS